MQTKKTDENYNVSSLKSKTSNSAQNMSKKKVILMGVGTGVVGACVVGYWLLHKDIPMAQKIKSIEQMMTPAPKSPAITQNMPPPPPLVMPPPPPSHMEMPPPPPPSHMEMPAPPPKVQHHPVVPAVPAHVVQNKQKKSVAKEKAKDNFNFFDEEVNLSKPQKMPPPVVNRPQIGSKKTYAYSAMTSGPVVTSRPHAHVIVSRDAHFKSVYVMGETDKDGEFRITNPPPGIIYWKVSGNNKVNKIIVAEPESTALKLNIPAELKIGDSFTWSGNKNVGYYKLEISTDPSFADNVRTYSMKTTTMNSFIVGTGNWFVRLGGLNIKSGAFDYTNVTPVSVVNLNNIAPKLKNNMSMNPKVNSQNLNESYLSPSSSNYSEIPSVPSFTRSPSPQSIETSTMTSENDFEPQDKFSTTAIHSKS